MSGCVAQKANSPPGRSMRATSGTSFDGSQKLTAPWSQNTMSKLSSRNGSCSPLAMSSGSGERARAWRSWAIEMSRPTLWEPDARRAMDHCAAPHPSPSTSRSATCPRAPDSQPGTQDVELALGHAEGTPRDRLPFQLGAMHRLIVVGVCIPEFTIPAYVVVAHDVHLTKRCTVPDSLVKRRSSATKR